jgi:hypothetical protein
MKIEITRNMGIVSHYHPPLLSGQGGIGQLYILTQIEVKRTGKRISPVQLVQHPEGI